MRDWEEKLLLLRELPPASIRGHDTAVPHSMPFRQFSRVFNGATSGERRDAERDLTLLREQLDGAEKELIASCDVLRSAAAEPGKDAEAASVRCMELEKEVANLTAKAEGLQSSAEKCAALGVGFGLQFSGVAHIPFIDELPSAWTGGRRDVNRSTFVMWDKSGEDTLFSLWKDGSPHHHSPHSSPPPSPLSCCSATRHSSAPCVVFVYPSDTPPSPLFPPTPAQASECTASSPAATTMAAPPSATRSARKGPFHM
jgi:hypothetical protein